MPWTLYRYILRELLKVLVLTTAVMVVVLSFVLAVGPLADGLLGPVTLLKFVAYTMPTVLGFALPFAGAFSATLVFHGLAKDNEILACRAGGLSYSRVLAPVVGLGLLLMLVLLLLSNTIVPRFWKAATTTVEGDVLGVLVSRLNQNRPYVFKDEGLVLYADAAERRDPPAGSSAQGLEAQQLLLMKGVAVGQYDQQSRRVLNDTTASSASALLVRDAYGKSYITLRLNDPIYYDAVSGELQTVGRFGEVQTDQPILLPNPVSDEATFFTLEQLIRLKREPQGFDKVREAKSQLAATVSREQLLYQIKTGLTGDDGGPGFVKLRGGLVNTYYRLSAPRVEVNDAGLVLIGSDEMGVTVDRYDNEALRGEPTRRFEADYAELRAGSGGFDLEPEAELTMHNVRVYALNETGEATNKEEYVFPAMRHPGQVLGIDPAELSSEALNGWAQRQAVGDVSAIKQARAMLRLRIIQLKHMIDAELYARFATALATPLLLILGALLAIRLSDRLPLVIFLWSFLFAILTLVMINTGSSMAEHVRFEDLAGGGGGGTADRLIGIGVLWGGNLVLLLVIARLYLRVARN